MAEPRPGELAGQAYHFRDTGSVLHGLGGGWKLGGAALAGAAGLAAGSPAALLGLLAAGVAGYRLARLGWAELWQDSRWLVLQGALIVALYILRDGLPAAGAGARTALHVALFFLPGALLLRTTPSAQLLAGLGGLLPRRPAFALATSLRLVPVFSRELGEIAMAQRLRGAHLSARELWRPRAWRDWIACVAFPFTVRAIRMAEEAALAAEVRGLPRREESA
jgi:energy-coupling factor transport system permease protein